MDSRRVTRSSANKSTPQRASASTPSGKGRGKQTRIDEALKAVKPTRGRERKQALKDSEELADIVKLESAPAYRISKESPDRDAAPTSSLKAYSQSPATSSEKSVTFTPSPKKRGKFDIIEEIEGDPEAKEELEVLKDFDLNGFYGACRGISRLERYERALKYNLSPPPSPKVRQILEEKKTSGDYWNFWNSCIWDQKRI